MSGFYKHSEVPELGKLYAAERGVSIDRAGWVRMGQLRWHGWASFAWELYRWGIIDCVSYSTMDKFGRPITKTRFFLNV